MRNGRLRQLHSLLNIPGTKSRFLAQRASAFFFQRGENAASGGIGNGMQETVEVRSCREHRESFEFRNPESYSAKFSGYRFAVNQRRPIYWSLFFHNRIVTITDKPCAHGLRFLQVSVRSDLHVIELVARIVVRGERGVLSLFERLNQ